MIALEKEKKACQFVMDTLSERCLGEMPEGCKKL